jgi:hypothetical protein
MFLSWKAFTFVSYPSSLSFTMPIISDFWCCIGRKPTTKQQIVRESSGDSMPSVPTRPAPLPPTIDSGPLSQHPVFILPAETENHSKTSLSMVKPLPGIPTDTIELAQLVIDESDDEDAHGRGSDRNRSTSTLEAVKKRLHRRISVDSDTRRKGRPMIGKSEEEVARRAELKRLMHKRIRDELGYDEAQTLLARHSTNSSAEKHAPPSIEVRIGPRDAIEFGVSEVSDDQPVASTAPIKTPSYRVPRHFKSLQKENTDSSRRMSCPENLNARQSSLRSHLSTATLKERTSLPYIPTPASPVLKPQRLPTFEEDSSLASWRLSYSAGQLTEVLGYDHSSVILRQPPAKTVKASLTPSDSANATASDLPPLGICLGEELQQIASDNVANRGSHVSSTDVAVLDTWLRTQEDHVDSPAPSAAAREELESVDDNMVATATVIRLKRTTTNARMLDAIDEPSAPAVLHLYDMDIHRKLATRGPLTPSDSPTRGSLRHLGETSADSQLIDRSGLTDSDQVAVARPHSRIASSGAWHGMLTASSSRYPSAHNSRNASTHSSMQHMSGGEGSTQLIYPLYPSGLIGEHTLFLPSDGHSAKVKKPRIILFKPPMAS